MSLLYIILVIVVVGVLLWALNSFIPMDAKIRQILNVVVVIALVLWLLQAFGILDSLGSIQVGEIGSLGSAPMAENGVSSATS